jgi:hypothetical protein
MRKIALCSLALVASLYAQSDIKKFEVTPFIGFNMFDGNSAMENDSLFGIRGTFNLDKYYGIRASYEGAFDARYSKVYQTLAVGNSSNDSATNGSSLTDVHRYLGEVVVRGDEEYNVIPYVFLGLGYESLSDETIHDVSQGLLDGGLGFKYQAWKDLNLILEGKVLRKFDTHDIDTAITLGIGYIFGKSFINPTRTNDSFDTKPLPAIQKIEPKKSLFEPIADNSVKFDSSVKLNDILEDTPIYKTEIYEDNTYENNAVVQVDVIDGGVIDDSDFVESDGDTTLDDILENSSTSSVASIGSVKFSTVSVVGAKQYYVKLATLFKKGSSRSLMKSIEKKNYQAQEIDSVIKGKNVRYIVAGPFNDKVEAKSALSILKSVKKGAYITKL